MRIPVCNSEGVIIERVDESRARRVVQAPNARIVKKRKGGVVRIILESVGDDAEELSLHANPRSYSHRHETDSNVENCWTLKRIPTSTADIFGAVVNSLALKNHESEWCFGTRRPVS